MYNVNLKTLDFSQIPEEIKTDVSKAIRLYSKGTSIKKCSNVVDISRYRLSRYFKKLGIPTDQFLSRPIPVKVTQFGKDGDNEFGKPIVFKSRRECSDKMGYSIRTVYYKLSEGSMTREGHKIVSSTTKEYESFRNRDKKIFPRAMDSLTKMILKVSRTRMSEKDLKREIVLDTIWGIKIDRTFPNIREASKWFNISVDDIITSVRKDRPVTDMLYKFKWKDEN